MFKVNYTNSMVFHKYFEVCGFSQREPCLLLVCYANKCEIHGGKVYAANQIFIDINFKERRIQ
jgi:hypothetical protein